MTCPAGSLYVTVQIAAFSHLQFEPIVNNKDIGLI